MELIPFSSLAPISPLPKKPPPPKEEEESKPKRKAADDDKGFFAEDAHTPAKRRAKEKRVISRF